MEEGLLEHVPKCERVGARWRPISHAACPSFPNALCNDNPGQRPEVASVDTPEDARSRWGSANAPLTRIGSCAAIYSGMRLLRSSADPAERVLEDLDKTVDKSTMTWRCWHRFLNNDRGIQEFAAWDDARGDVGHGRASRSAGSVEDEAWGHFRAHQPRAADALFVDEAWRSLVRPLLWAAEAGRKRGGGRRHA